MKRRITALLLTLVLALGLSTAAGAYTNQQYRAADALYHLDLFRGMSTTSKVYNLDGGLKRFEGTILLLRMIGEEKAAEKTAAAENPFADVTDWTVPYLTYAWKTGLVNGRTATSFDPAGDMSDYMFLTLVLRVLGYSDAGGADFVWNDPYGLAKQLGLIAATTPDDEFTRGDAVLIFWKAMAAKFKGTNETLAQRLMAQKVFTANQYAEAKEIWTYGYVLEDEPSTPSTPSAPSTPSDPNAPEISDDLRDDNGEPIAGDGEFGSGSGWE